MRIIVINRCIHIAHIICIRRSLILRLRQFISVDCMSVCTHTSLYRSEGRLPRCLLSSGLSLILRSSWKIIHEHVHSDIRSSRLTLCVSGSAWPSTGIAITEGAKVSVPERAVIQASINSGDLIVETDISDKLR